MNIAKNKVVTNIQVEIFKVGEKEIKIVEDTITLAK